MKTWITLVAASACGAAYAESSPLTGRIDTKLMLTSGCVINAGGGSVGATSFGTLDFGMQPSGFTGSLRSAVSGSGSSGAAQITCSPDVAAVQVTVDAGRHGGKGAGIGAGTRAVSNGASYVPYEIYADKAGSTQYVSDTAQTISVPTPGAAFDLPVYGVANKVSPSALDAGAYNDTLSITLGW
ncbi:spore coat U domain-containing protein [Burkholderia sp. FERM BP-3421]|nr:spore coat protein U domain-containing protein [Burkholderia sp. FERM BP-3421]WDD91517.1 spore coat U domain-containing protein [Burkholderia sp. FERM BP-3421]